jgi:iron complex transport system permease protein
MLSRTRPTLFILTLVIASLFISIIKGSIPVSLYQLFFEHQGHFGSLFLTLRLERTANAFISGGLLAMAGVLMQLLLQNPLADPYVLGASSGAALFTLIMILLGVGETWFIGGAWAGSILSIMLVFLLARQHEWQTHSLLLFGIAMACFYSACISLVLLISPATKLHSMLFWLTGDLNGSLFSWPPLFILAAGTIACILLAPGLNILTRGDQEAGALGLATRQYHIAIYLLSSLFTAAAVTLSGCIGFIGLLTPHIIRRLVGTDHRILLPVSMLTGGSLLTIADTIARTVVAPEQLPVGILLALLGVPVFIWMLR